MRTLSHPAKLRDKSRRYIICGHFRRHPLSHRVVAAQFIARFAPALMPKKRDKSRRYTLVQLALWHRRMMFR
jgi:hypothetical protein